MERSAPTRGRALAAWRRLLPGLAGEAEDRLGRAEAVAFLARLEASLFDVYEPLDTVYGNAHDTDALVGRLVRVALSMAAQRPAELRELDRRREIDAHWYQRARMIGYV